MVPLPLAAIGLSSAFGAGLENHLDKVKGRGNAFRRQRKFMGSDFKPQLTAFDGDLGFEPALTRMEALATAALDDLAPPVLPPDGKLHIAIALPEPAVDEGLSPPALSGLAETLFQLAARRLDRGDAIFHQFHDGSAAVATAILHCHPTLQPGDALLILATDSYRCRQRLGVMMGAGRLFSKQDRYGLIPGEAAAALLFVSDVDDGGLTDVLGAAVQTERVGEFDEGGTDFAALSSACRYAVGDTTDIPLWITDWNNGRYRAAELSYCQLRLQYALTDRPDILHLPLIFGDIGAATLGVGLGIATAHQNLLLTASASKSGHRAAVLCG